MSSQLTDVQKAAIEIVPRCMAGLSVCGSACVFWTVFWNQRTSKKRDNRQNGRRRPASAPQHQHQHQQSNPSNNRATPMNSSRETVSQVAGNLLICLSLMDLLSSFSYVFGSVMFPTESGGKGNQATCNGTYCTTCTHTHTHSQSHLIRCDPIDPIRSQKSVIVFVDDIVLFLTIPYSFTLLKYSYANTKIQHRDSFATCRYVVEQLPTN